MSLLEIRGMMLFMEMVVVVVIVIRNTQQIRRAGEI